MKDSLHIIYLLYSFIHTDIQPTYLLIISLNNDDYIPYRRLLISTQENALVKMTSKHGTPGIILWYHDKNVSQFLLM